MVRATTTVRASFLPHTNMIEAETTITAAIQATGLSTCMSLAKLAPFHRLVDTPGFASADMACTEQATGDARVAA